ncbi:hypothetical protein D8674_026298 [Pyrus ussuriensis x Pyrus communis]|uniref:RPW8 domain-containing protein n=1 Tax=Pyrus ussuriensis x Pyrus communis TaxID=2448454 RepID=A0A5N5IKZ0_9ROSA|nr:hypothetical protein D8674_026298 [Pyrus ussuriensis x Pyrus communis]
MAPKSHPACEFREGIVNLCRRLNGLHHPQAGLSIFFEEGGVHSLGPSWTTRVPVAVERNMLPANWFTPIPYTAKAGISASKWSHFKRGFPSMKDEACPREILRAQQEAKGVQELSGSNILTVVHEQIGGSGVKQVESINGVGAALRAVFEVLFGTLIQTKEKTRMFTGILGELEITLHTFKPLIEEIAEYNKLLHLTEEETGSFRVEMEKGVELVHKCSQVNLWASNKKMI